MNESTLNQQQDRRIDDIHKMVNTRVSWQIFIWTIGVIITVIVIVVSYSLSANNKSDDTIKQTSEIKGDIKSINTSLGFIQASLLEIKQEIKQNGK